MLDFLKYNLWPAVKVKTRYWWWIVKYWGKKDIPPRLIFGQLQKSMMRMKDSLQEALRHLPKDIGDEGKQMLLDAIGKAEELDRKQQELTRR